MNKYMAWLVANTVWFGFFMVAILKYGWTPFALIVPIAIHWRMRDLETPSEDSPSKEQ